MLDGIGFPSLERYPNTFFTDQIAQLEQAIIDSPITSIRSKPIQINQNFEDTLQGKLFLWMSEHREWKTYQEIAAHLGKSRKQVAKYMRELGLKGIFCERRMNKNVMQIRIV